MQISFITPHLQVRGANRRIIELSNHLIKLDHQVRIYHSDGSKCSWMDCSAQTLPLSQVTKDKHQILIETNRRNYPIFSKTNADLKMFYVLLLYEEVFHLMTGFKPQLKLPYHKYNRWFRSMLHDSSIIKLSNSTGVKQKLDSIGVDNQLLLGGINHQMFYPAKQKKQFDYTILASGDPVKWKGFEDIQQAIAKLKKKYPKINLITYAGKNIPQDQMADLYQSADIFVDAQTEGGWNNPVAEAMACGVPVICTNIGSIKDLAIDRKTALLVPTRDPKAITDAISDLIDNPKLRNKLAENGHNQSKKFRWDSSAKNLIKIIDQYV